MRKNVSVILLTICLSLVVVLAACSKTNEPSNTPASTQGADGGEAAQTPEPTVEPIPRSKITSALYDRGSVPGDEGTIEKNRWTDWLNENGPHDVTFVAIPRWESEAKYNTLFASNSAPDLLFEYSPWIRNAWYDQRLLQPLDDLIDKYAPVYRDLMDQFPALRKAGTMPDGNLYYMGKLNEVVPIRAILVRKDWLDALELQVPTTTEELYLVAKAFAERDPDNNGQNDTYGMAVSGNSSGRTIDQMFQNIGWVVRGDDVEYSWDSFEEAAKFMKRLYDEGIIDRDFLTDTNGQKARQDFVTGKLGIYPVQLSWTSFIRNEYKALMENEPNAELIPIALPVSPAGAFNPTFQNPVQMTAAVNRGAANPEAVVEFADFMVQSLTGHTLTYGFEGVHYELDENGCPSILDGDQKSEIGYMTDGTMLHTSSIVTEGKCGSITQLNLNDPLEREGLQLFEMAKQVYFDLSRPYAEITHSEHLPTLPRDLGITVNETYNAIGEAYLRAVVGGSDYTVDMMMKDVADIWAKGMGPDAEKWWKEWYAENKDTAFLAQDIYDVVRQQHGIQ